MSGTPLFPDFDGRTFDPKLDGVRLNAQSKRVLAAMADGKWRTFSEIEAITGDPQPSISARLRDFRKKKFGAYQMESRRRGGSTSGLWEYRVMNATRSAQQNQGGEGGSKT